MKANLVLYFLMIVFLCQCTINEVGPPGKDGGFDLQLRFPIGNPEATTAISDTIRIDDRYNLIRFDKRNYLNVDSIVFSSRMRSVIDQDTCIVLLRNVTDNTFITSATLRSDTTVFRWVNSGNILSALPSRSIDLGVVLISKRTGTLVEGGQSFLFLYRKED
jgi:hypothetical protein